MHGRELWLMRPARASRARIAISCARGDFAYSNLLRSSARVAATLLRASDDLNGARIAFLIEPGFSYAAVQWGIWRAGGIAVPLALSHPAPELAYVLDDADASVVIAADVLCERVRGLSEARTLRFLTTPELFGGAAASVRDAEPDADHSAFPPIEPDRGAMILYTSGTTSRPKGVVISHGNIEAQVSALTEAWAWRESDHILCTLPLHHVHGIVNVLTCALGAGARCTMLPRVDAEEVWNIIGRGDLTLFMAVPTIYTRLIAAWEAFPAGRQAQLSAACRHMRLMVSGSAALPVGVLERWRTISGHTLLERYGMTEIGMALSNPLDGERRPGFVGTPLPGVELRLVDEQDRPVPTGEPGEIQVRGPAVFHEYWRRPEATRDAFRDGWFRTGDIAVLENGSYRILGRSNIDIIKTGGYKVSALEIEEVLRTHGAVQECAVVGLADEEWGELVCAAVVAAEGVVLDPEELRVWAREQLAAYKVPARVVCVGELPRNVMGKVVKAEVRRLILEASRF